MPISSSDSEFRFTVESLATSGLVVVVAFVGFARLLEPEVEPERTAEYGILTYVMVGLAVPLTVLFLAQLVAA